MTTRPVVQNASQSLTRPATPGPAPSGAGAARASGVASAAATDSVELTGNKEKRAAHAAKNSAAEVEISPAAKARAEAMKKAGDIARNTPDVREDRVAALKAQIDAGTYKVDSGKIADGMMREAILDHLAESDER